MQFFFEGLLRIIIVRNRGTIAVVNLKLTHPSELISSVVLIFPENLYYGVTRYVITARKKNTIVKIFTHGCFPDVSVIRIAFGK